MARSALLRSGKGLGTPGTTRKKRQADAARASAPSLDDLDHIETTLRACVDAAGATLLHIHLHRFEPSGGVSGVAVLAESHISIHSWPEHGYAALDIFMCGNTNPDVCVPLLREAFAARKISVSEHLRGCGLG